ncbi:NADP-dependent oxidoreductase [Pigmentiphaga sp. NML080357]|uniref:NADP-dependent oxidoreductase n=1 Tax=Pigmentiphaga sp. NML080357 TaxID=2008675 RepID=UPI000B423267|nr:NADP-dependent oxidoreductase [Pigmentiphaga sp. NML080357]OVZ57139.1 NADP-dependent oxidoreductase [Pigmentiphaga sp. NML080357]
MPQSASMNRRIVMVRRPAGAPSPADFRMETVPVPAPGDGQVLLQTVYLSLDPYMRGRMSDAASYAKPLGIGDVMLGGTISRVVESRHPDFPAGELVLAASGWQDYAVSSGKGLTRLPASLAHPSWALGVLGMPGFTAYVGLLQIGTPKAGETVAVGAATGAVGSVVGQIAKLHGCRVVGIAGGPDKCDYAIRELGFDACLDHRAGDLPARLAAACPDGIDVYFESVGGAVFDAVLPLLNRHARIPLCGLISQYNAVPGVEAPDRLPMLMRLALTKSLRIQGFIVSDWYGPLYRDFARQMNAWVADGQVRYREDVVEGLENAPAAFMGLLEGRNFGKLVVKVSR